MHAIYDDLKTFVAGRAEELKQGADAMIDHSRGLAHGFDLDGVSRFAAQELPFLVFVVLLGGAILAWRRLRRARPASSRELKSLIRGPRVLGYGAVLAFFGGFGGWAAYAMLASAAIAPGVVSPDGYRKTVQHLEGGIIRAIHVREGEIVDAGQALVTLEATEARGRYEELRERYIHYLALEARLSAEQMGAEEIEFPEELATLGGELASRSAEGQRELMHSRRDTRQSRERILRQRVRQIEEQISGFENVIESQTTQFSLIERELEGLKVLYDKGLERLPRLLALERAKAEILAGQGTNRAQIARHQEQIGETEIQLLTLRQQETEAVNEELTRVRAALAELRSQLPSRQDVLARRTIAAPISGIVMNLRITTESGVIGAGQPIVDIVPMEPDLVIDARVRPVDIDMVHAGLKARVMLSAYRQRYLPQIHGTVRSVSADRLVDERSGEPYFLAKIDVDPAELSRLENVRLSPGMPAEVMILTGEQSLFDYIVNPLSESMSKSFREY